MFVSPLLGAGLWFVAILFSDEIPQFHKSRDLFQNFQPYWSDRGGNDGSLSIFFQVGNREKTSLGEIMIPKKTIFLGWEVPPEGALPP